jgi:prepilin-type N-terminal cleavage/methylation domain-containing protein
MRQQHRKNQGFTLIELSIVLVIIGLIIGGVLVGHDLIKAAETRATLAQIEKYNSATNTFKTKYNGIPGDLGPTDAGNFGLTVGTGCDGSAAGLRNGDGLLDGAPAVHPFFEGLGEVELFWSDLSAAGFIDSAIPNGNAPAIVCNSATPSTALSNTQIGEYLPYSKTGNNNFVYVYETNGNNWFGLAAVTGLGNNAYVPAMSVSVAQAYNMDKKIDDGLPTTGNVLANYIPSRVALSNAPSGNPDTASTCYNSSTLTYSMDVSNGSNVNCALSFKMQGAAR